MRMAPQRTPSHAHHPSNWMGGTCLLCCVRYTCTSTPSWSGCPTSSASIPPHPLESQDPALASDTQCPYCLGGNTECVPIPIKNLMPVPHQWDNILPLPPAACTRGFISNAARTGHEPFPKPVPTVLTMSRFAQPKPSGQSTFLDGESDLMQHKYRLSVLQRSPAPARKNPTHILAAACGRFHAVILQEASDHDPHVSDQFIAHTGGTDLAILLNIDTFEPDAAVLTISEASSSKDTWGLAALVVRGLLRRSSLRLSLTFCSVHVHNIVAKSSPAPSCPHGAAQRRLQGDFNMSAFSTLGDVFSDPEFAAPGNSLL